MPNDACCTSPSGSSTPAPCAPPRAATRDQRRHHRRQRRHHRRPATAASRSRDAVPQVSGADARGGTWRVAGTLELAAAPTLTTIGAGASVELAGSGLRSRSSRASPRVVRRAAPLGRQGPRRPDRCRTAAPFAVGPASRLSVNGAFTTQRQFMTDIAGAPASGQFGDVVATGSLALGGTGACRARPELQPVARRRVHDPSRRRPSTSFVRPASTRAGFAPSYTATAFVLNGTGSVPIADAGPDISVDRGHAADRRARARRLRARPTSTARSRRTSGRRSDRPRRSPTRHRPGRLPAADDASFTATLEVCDNDGLCDTDSAQVTVTNVAPTLSLDPVRPVRPDGRRASPSRRRTPTPAASTPTRPPSTGSTARRPRPVLAPAAHHGHPHLRHHRRRTRSRSASPTTTVARACALGRRHGRRATTRRSRPTTPRPPTRTPRSTSTCSTTTPTPTRRTTSSSSPRSRRRPIGTTEVVGGARALHAGARPLRHGLLHATRSSDGELTDDGTVTVTVTCVNDAPVANAGGDRSIHEGSPRRSAPSRRDVDGDTRVTASWSPAAGLDDANVAAADRARRGRRASRRTR